MLCGVAWLLWRPTPHATSVHRLDGFDILMLVHDNITITKLLVVNIRIGEFISCNGEFARDTLQLIKSLFQDVGFASELEIIYIYGLCSGYSSFLKQDHELGVILCGCPSEGMEQSFDHHVRYAGSIYGAGSRSKAPNYSTGCGEIVFAFSHGTNGIRAVWQ